MNRNQKQLNLLKLMLKRANCLKGKNEKNEKIHKQCLTHTIYLINLSSQYQNIRKTIGCANIYLQGYNTEMLTKLHPAQNFIL